MGYKHNDLPTPRREADEYQVTRRGGLISGMGDSKDSPETVGPHHLNKTSGSDVSCQITWNSENDSEQLQEQAQHLQDSGQNIKLGQGGHQLVEESSYHRMQRSPWTLQLSLYS